MKKEKGLLINNIRDEKRIFCSEKLEKRRGLSAK